MAENGGIMTEKDFADYRAPFREPVKSTYRGNTIYGMPPASSGGVYVEQIMTIVEHFEVGELEEAVRVDVVEEAMKLEIADRADCVDVAEDAVDPNGLVARMYG